MNSKMIFDIFYDSFPDFRERIYAYQEDNSNKNSIKLIFRKDDPMYKLGRFSIEHGNSTLELFSK